MSVEISGKYIGGLSLEMTHGPSKVKLLTDPPLDNGGMASSYSPTDLVATALGSCMLSVVAIAAKKENILLEGMNFKVSKHMSSDLPRRISCLDVKIQLPKSLSEPQRTKLMDTANACPVIQSLNPAIQINKTYEFI
jgi:putative redox protein